MALNCFYLLKEKKKTRIFDAIGQCLQIYNYDKLSINDIIREADISRGSFYNYFIDKNDAVETYVHEKINNIFEIFKNSIAKNNYSLFDGIYNGYYQLKGIVKKQTVITIIGNLKHFIDTGIKVAYSKAYENELKKNIEWLVENTQEGKSILNNKEKMSNVLDILMSLITNTTLKNLLSNDSNINDGFDFKFNVIKLGIEKNTIEIKK